MGLAFFKLSIGMGCMITYGAYYRKEQDIPATASRVVLADLAISLLAGIAIFPAVFAFGFEPAAGPSLLFITIPAVFSSMPLGSIFMVIFFILTFIASIGAQLSLLEVITAYLENTFNLSRKVGTAITVISLALVGSTAALSNSLLANVKLFGMNFFDLFDFGSSNILLPVGIFHHHLCRLVLGQEGLFRSGFNEGSLKNSKSSTCFSRSPAMFHRCWFDRTAAWIKNYLSSVRDGSLGGYQPPFFIRVSGSIYGSRPGSVRTHPRGTAKRREGHRLRAPIHPARPSPGHIGAWARWCGKLRQVDQ